MPRRAPPTFRYRISPADLDSLRLQGFVEGHSPVAAKDLVSVSFSHHTMDGGTAMSRMIIHASVAGALRVPFLAMWEDGFPIEQVEGFEHMLSSPGVWSLHAFGLAVNLNSVRSNDPDDARTFADRSVRRPGMIFPGDAVVRAFAAIGWKWGGDFTESDYMHFYTKLHTDVDLEDAPFVAIAKRVVEVVQSAMVTLPAPNMKHLKTSPQPVLECGYSEWFDYDVNLTIPHHGRHVTAQYALEWAKGQLLPTLFAIKLKGLDLIDIDHNLTVDRISQSVRRHAPGAPFAIFRTSKGHANLWIPEKARTAEQRVHIMRE